MKTLIFSSAILLIVALWQSNDSAQASRIAGVVCDSNKARIVHASITIKNNNVTREVYSDDEGKFEAELPTGIYRLTVEHPGFKTFNLSPFRANPGQTVSINITMMVEPPQSTVKIDSTRE